MVNKGASVPTVPEVEKHFDREQPNLALRADMRGESTTSPKQESTASQGQARDVGGDDNVPRPQEGNEAAESSDAAERRAAEIIQKHYRGHAVRKNTKSMKL